MKTITITIQIEDSERPQTIKGTMLEQIAIAKENKERCQKLLTKQVQALFEIREQFMNELNAQLGEDLWKIGHNEERSYRNMGDYIGVDIELYPFNYNTTKRNYIVTLRVPIKTHYFGEKKWSEPLFGDVVIDLTNELGNSGVEYRPAPKIRVNSIDDIHKKCESLYLKYFTEKHF